MISGYCGVRCFFPLNSCAMIMVDVNITLGTFLILSERKSSSACRSFTVIFAMTSYSP